MSVINIKDSEFESYKSEHNKIIIKYYADWCGACRLISPKFKRLSENEEYKNISFIEINAEENPEARKFSGVSNLPFFSIIENGELKSGDNFAKEERILEYLQQLNS